MLLEEAWLILDQDVDLEEGNIGLEGGNLVWEGKSRPGPAEIRCQCRPAGVKMPSREAGMTA
jgi:hypothetical protein